MNLKNKSGMIAPLICLMLIVTAFTMVVSDKAEGSVGGELNDSSGYYYSGAMMESLSNSRGISSDNYKVNWSLDNSRGYAISGNYAYVFTSDGKLNKVSLDDGTVITSVERGTTGSAFPCVNDEMVLDPYTGNVYDLNLNQKYQIDATSDNAYYNDGHWYVVQRDKTCKCFTIEDEDTTDAKNVQEPEWTSTFTFFIDAWTLTIALAFSDKALYYPGIGASDTNQRIIYCVDKSTGEQLDTFEMTEIRSTYWNAGFISYYDGTVYVSAHWDAMFMPYGDGTKPVFVQVKTNSDGKFDPSTVKYTCNGVDNSYSSAIVKVGNLGFAQTGRSFMVFDLNDNMKILAQTPIDKKLAKIYSNIAIAYGSDDLVYGYAIPSGVPTSLADAADGIVGFEYRISTNEIKTFELNVGETNTSTTNSIKIGPNGELLFAKNNSVLYCITQDVKSYYVNFDANGGSGDMARGDVSGTYTLPACTFTAPEGKKFLGWAYSPTGDVISGTTINVTADVTLYAIWGDSSYSISFNANGGSGTMANVSVLPGTYSLPACSFTAPDGKKFLGWAYSSNGPVISGTTINVTSDVTLYAIWEDNHPSSSNTVTIIICAVVVLAIIGAAFLIYKHRP